MSDSYPDQIVIEIDRPRLQTYLRIKWFLSWMAGVGGLAGIIAIAPLGAAIERGIHSHSWRTGVAMAASTVAIGFGVASLLALLLYLLLSHRRAARFAASLEVSVEGAFLRIRQHDTTLSDRKIHFRAIVDYATTQGPLRRRFGLHTLEMTTTASGLQSIIRLPGVKDCLRVRDLLAEIDHQRENQ